ncbi:hypothetical protein EG68_00044 [Paragonimus skrjabini miyazakii]|uniref:Uncharacterized protein n=1 Tax=Paragonimus skrjabini miyazakii TaxID=59628 RepID=A0A8S9Z5E5_9TREM|nr:hypothetical protein EG68_00044 [Paragonimus skrjabini miyazakii]
MLKPDKSSGPVVMDKEEYIRKMLSILNDESKFQRIDKVEKVTDMETRIIRHLDLLLLHRIIDEGTFKSLKPSGSSTTQLYGLPKTHKPGVPLKPILSMVQALTSLKRKFDTYIVKESSDLIEDLNKVSLADKVKCSFKGKRKMKPQPS